MSKRDAIDVCNVIGHSNLRVGHEWFLVSVQDISIKTASDGREVLIVQCRRLLEMDVISVVIMGSAWNMEWWSLWKTRTS